MRLTRPGARKILGRKLKRERKDFATKEAISAERVLVEIFRIAEATSSPRLEIRRTARQALRDAESQKDGVLTRKALSDRRRCNRLHTFRNRPTPLPLDCPILLQGKYFVKDTMPA